MGSCESHEASTPENGSTKKDEEELKNLAIGAGLLLAAWVVSTIFGGSRKTMKAPGRDYYIFRDEFEDDPAAYFRRLRDY
ncbi:hypothetical protein BUALT_Bualt17G0085000 [Buddleja alternifolia]|uniref:Uncharacterized protein n=1 Tax=Buddleja alternifolia TaxID=168488 RepID=A0AAV6W7N3_9LAMI|nr:hypothetical protein BUALT_Bualt17G0085000 [Buddleja alternifolia]